MKTPSRLPALLGLTFATPLLHAGVILQNDFEPETVGAFPAMGFVDLNGTLAASSNTSIESGTLPGLTEGQPYRFEFHLNRSGAVVEYPDPTNPANPPV